MRSAGQAASAGGRGRYILSPFADFALAGGFSLLFFAALPLVPSSSPLSGNLIAFTFYLSFIVNGPHFIYSYQLLYDGIGGKLFNAEVEERQRRRYWIAAVIAPCLLVLLFSAVMLFPSLLTPGVMVSLMLFLVGWHYVRQGFGTLVALSARKGVYFSERERKVLNAHMLLCWALSWALANAMTQRGYAFGVEYGGVSVPWFAVYALSGAVCLATLALAGMVIRRGRRKMALPSFNGAVGYLCATNIWLFGVFLHPVYMAYVPAFHSMQYLLFVWALKSREYSGLIEDKPFHARALVQFFSAGAVLAGLCFYFIPTTLEAWVSYDKALYGNSFFILLCAVFINIHHYVIDYAIWRKSDAKAARYL